MSEISSEPVRTKSIKIWRFFSTVFLPLVLAMVLFWVMMKPSMPDTALMLMLMGGTALVTSILAYLAYRFGWIHQAPGIRWMLMGGYAGASLLIFLNTWIIARLMFASAHDLQLATVLLFFASGIALSVGYFLSEAITDRISMMSDAFKKISDGQLDIRVKVDGKDEMAGLAGLFNEMSEQLELAQQKQKELEALRSDLIAWVGHDLRTPMTSIRAILEALADGMVDDPETVQRYLRTAQKDICSLSYLIDDLFEMSQMDAGGMKLDIQMNSISDLVSDTIESFTKIAEEAGVTLEGRLSNETSMVPMDVQKVGRVFANLVSNAIRYTPSGGRVEIMVLQDEGCLNVHICDTGEGISEADLPHVFERFYRGEKSRNRSTGGSGLGLAISKGIVDAHGGEISVRSDVGKGTCFTFCLPLMRGLKN
jgi:signal transduction histidine kinase